MPIVEMNRRITPIRRAFLIAFTLLIVAACGGGASSDPTIDLVPVATELRPTPDGYAFANFAAGASPEEFTTDDLVKMFGAEACTGGIEVACEPIAEAAAWARMVNQARQPGHCEGIVVEASKRFNLSLLPQTVELVNEGEVTHQIIRTFGTQFLPEVQNETNEWQKKSLSAIVAELVDSFKTGKPKYSMGLYVEQGGHALLPYAVEFPSPELARIQLYDSNWPGKNRYVDVDLNAKKWQFSFSGEDPANDPDAWTGGEGYMDLTSLDTRNNSTCPFCASKTKVKNSMIVISSVDRNWSVTTDKGIYSPSSDRLVEGVTARPIRGSADSPPIGEDVPPPVRYQTRNDALSLEYVVFVEGKNITLKLPSTTSAFVSQGSAVVQLTTTTSSDDRTVSISNISVSVDDPTVNVKIASGDLAADVAGNNTVIDIANKQLNISVETTTGQKIEAVVNQETPAISAKAPELGSTDFVVKTQTVDNSLQIREIARDGSEVVKTQLATKLTELSATSIDIPEVLQKSEVKPGLPPRENRDLANPEYTVDAPFTPTVGLLVSKLAVKTELSTPLLAAVKNEALPESVASSVSTSTPTTTTVPPSSTTATPTTVKPTTTTTTTTVPPTTTAPSTTTTTSSTTTTVPPTTTTSSTTTTTSSTTTTTAPPVTTTAPPVTTTTTSTTTTIAVTVPGAPTSVYGTSGNTQVSLTWYAPASTGGSAITDYVVQFSTSASSGFTTFSDGTSSATTATVTGLTNSTVYYFKVAAVNSVGTSAYSAVSSGVTPGVASAPTSLSVSSGRTGMNVSWTAPTSTGGSAITDYVIQYTTSPGYSYVTFSDGTSTTTSATITGLIAGSTYYIRVAAVTSLATGTYSSESSGVLSKTCANGGVCALGDTGPGGGKVYYVHASGTFDCGATLSQTCKYLEVAPNTWSGGVADPTKLWATSTYSSTDILSITNDSVPYNNALGIGLGYKNSLAIVGQGNDATTAAGAARAYAGGSQSDWYLPTTAELNLLCQWARDVTQSVTTECTGGTLNTGTGASFGFFNSDYWSSSEFGASSSWFHGFYGYQWYAVKSINSPSPYVRPVRAFD